MSIRSLLPLVLLGASLQVTAQPVVTTTVNLASAAPGPVAPGSLASVRGRGLSADARVVRSSLPAAFTLNGTRVLVDGVAAPVFSVSPEQVDFQVPSETAIGTAEIRVETPSGSAQGTVIVAKIAEQIFEYGDKQAIAINPDGLVSAASAPSKPGDVLVVFGTGLGLTWPPIWTNQISPLYPPRTAPAPVTAQIGGVPAPVLFAGLTPGTVGLMQVNLRVPNVPSGNQPLILSEGGTDSNAPYLSVASSLTPSKTGTVCGFAPTVSPDSSLDWNTCGILDLSAPGGLPRDSYRVSRPGVLYFDPSQRRKDLQAAEQDLLALYCDVNPMIQLSASLPTIQFSTASLNLTADLTSVDGQLLPSQSANMSFTNLTTSDGYTLPRFGFSFNKPPAPFLTWVVFDPATNSDLRNIPGLDKQIGILWNDRTGQVILPQPWPLSKELRRLMYSVVLRLPELLGRATSTTVRNAPGGVLAWNSATAIAWAGQYRDALQYVPDATIPASPSLTCPSSALPSCTETTQMFNFVDMLRAYSAEYYVHNTRTSFRTLTNNLSSWAAANSLLTYPIPLSDVNEFRIKYTILQVGLPLMQAWAVLRNDPDTTQKTKDTVNNWLDQLMPIAVAPYGGSGNPNNSGYLQWVNRMAWGIFKGTDELFRDGIDRFWTALHQMRADGSFPLETARGRCALDYQSQALAPLIGMAELAATQGYDLYSFNVGGKTIHDAVKFLVDAADNTALLDPYFQPYGACAFPVTDPYDQGGLRDPRGSIIGYPTPWIESYIARFPGAENSVRLARLPNGALASARPLFHNHSGGNTTCMKATAASLH